jgi:hypothetical protein
MHMLSSRFVEKRMTAGHQTDMTAGESRRPWLARTMRSRPAHAATLGGKMAAKLNKMRLSSANLLAAAPYAR